MELSRLVRACGCVVLVLGSLCVAASAQMPPAEKKDAGDFEKLVEIFAPPGFPSIKGKAWVTVEIGPANWSLETEGWLIEDGKTEITILEFDGEIHTLRKPVAGEERVKFKEDADGTVHGNIFDKAHRGVAWKVQAEDFGAKSKKFLADGLPKDTEVDDPNDINFVSRALNKQFEGWNHVVDSARYADVAHQLGQHTHAADLYAHALKAHQKYAGPDTVRAQEYKVFHLFVAERIGLGFRNRAIYDGHDSTSRKELKKQWERIAAIPFHQYRDEAKEMAKHYQSLIDEDAQWVQPDAKSFEKLTTEQKVAYWIYHLRDLDVGQWSDPGTCLVLYPHFAGIGNAEKERPNAAVELQKLGMAAVPQLIALLNDALPTRCKGHWRSYWPDGHYLLRYGDCCQQIFVGITGQPNYRGSYPIQDGAGKRCKEDAEKWWREYQEKKK